MHEVQVPARIQCGRHVVIALHILKSMSGAIYETHCQDIYDNLQEFNE